VAAVLVPGHFVSVARSDWTALSPPPGAESAREPISGAAVLNLRAATSAVRSARPEPAPGLLLGQAITLQFDEMFCAVIAEGCATSRRFSSKLDRHPKAAS
jgi:hypothetical protein